VPASPTSNERIYYMDLARSLILLTGVFFHAALLYQDEDNQMHLHWFTPVLSSFLSFIRSYRMEVLFVVSGFFSAVLVSRRGTGGFFRNRLVRMGVPLLFCGILFNPFPYLFLPSPSIPWLHLGFFVSGEWMNHLWNVANLLVYEATMFSLLTISPKFHPWLARIRIGAPLALLVYMVVWIAANWIWEWLPSFPGANALVFAGALPLYAPAYLLGYAVHQNKRLRESLFDWRIMLPTMVGFFLLEHALSHRIETLANDGSRWVAYFNVLKHILRGCLLFSLVRAFETRNVWVRRIAIASYTIYILHLPLQMLLLEWIPPLRHGYPAFFLLSLVPILVVWTFHVQVVERWNWAGFLFNGKIYDNKTRSF